MNGAVQTHALQSVERLYNDTRRVLDKAKLGKIDAVIGQKRKLDIAVQILPPGDFQRNSSAGCGTPASLAMMRNYGRSKATFGPMNMRAGDEKQPTPQSATSAATHLSRRATTRRPGRRFALRAVCWRACGCGRITYR